MKEVIDLILANDLYGVSEAVEIAKGKYERITTFREAKEKIKRIWLSKKY